MARKKKVPIRKCVGCQERRPKRELIRIVKDSEGEISIDTTGKKPGRGAYVCPKSDCFDQLMKKGRLEKAFMMNIKPSVYEDLRKELEEILAERSN